MEKRKNLKTKKNKGIMKLRNFVTKLRKIMDWQIKEKWKKNNFILFFEK